MEERETCPACGGAGGGPFGKAGSAWDDEEFVCQRCEGIGQVLVVSDPMRPGLAKTTKPIVEPGRRKQTG